MGTVSCVAGGVVSGVVLAVTIFGHLTNVAHFFACSMDVPAQCLGFVLVMFLFVVFLFVL